MFNFSAHALFKGKIIAVLMRQGKLNRINITKRYHTQLRQSHTQPRNRSKDLRRSQKKKHVNPYLIWGTMMAAEMFSTTVLKRLGWDTETWGLFMLIFKASKKLFLVL